MYKFGVNQYKKVGINTADRGKLLLMLYDGAIRFSLLAKQKMAEKDYGAKGTYISKVQSILFELIACLDHKVAPELCVSLEGLYLFMIEQLSDANINLKPEPIDAVVGILNTLREGWQEVVNGGGQAAATSTPTPASPPEPVVSPTQAESSPAQPAPSPAPAPASASPGTYGPGRRPAVSPPRESVSDQLQRLRKNVKG